MIRLAHASIDENGKVSGGAAGDQTGKEVCIRSWYSKPWNCVIRFKDPAMRQKVADCMIRAANNVRIGYDQMQRNSLLNYARNVGYDPYKVTTPCETDCSALVTLACIYAGVKEDALVKGGNSATTRTIKGLLLATGMVDVLTGSEFTAKADNLKPGDILLAEGHHVAVAVQTYTRMKTSDKGIQFLKAREGVHNKAYKLKGEQNYTIGVGHTFDPAINENTVWTDAQVDAALKKDLEKYESYVSEYATISLNQQQFDALVSYTFNRGKGGMKQLSENSHTVREYGENIVKYWGSATQYKDALIKRRKLEQDLFMNGNYGSQKKGNPYTEPTQSIRLGDKGEGVKWLQYELNRKGYILNTDGDAGNLTIGALMDYQKKNNLVVDGVCGTLTKAALKTL